MPCIIFEQIINRIQPVEKIWHIFVVSEHGFLYFTLTYTSIFHALPS
jgi:hypothetical protein